MIGLLIAYTAQNLGDDMFIDYICKRYSQVEFLLVCPPKYDQAFRSIPNLRVFKTYEELARWDKPIDIQILVGGSLFMQPRNQSDILAKCIANKRLRVFMDIPMIILGANFGPFSFDKFFQLHKQWFNTMDCISFRDRYSYDLFRDLNTVSWSPDILMSYPLPKRVDEKTVVISCINDNQRIGLPIYDEECYFNWIAKIASKYLHSGYRIRLASFCRHQGDLFAARSILERIQSNSAEIIEYSGDIDGFLPRFLSAEYILGTRFHSIILGMAADIPVYPIIYNQKTSNMLDSYGFSGNSSKIEAIEAANFEYVDYNRMQNIKVSRDKLVQDSEKHFSYLDNFFYNK